MTFTSWHFGMFVAVVFGGYYLPALRTYQVQWLVSASLFFYGRGQLNFCRFLRSLFLEPTFFWLWLYGTAEYGFRPASSSISRCWRFLNTNSYSLKRPTWPALAGSISC